MCTGPLPTDDVIADFLGAHNLKFSTYLNDPIFSALLRLPSQFGWNLPRESDGLSENKIFDWWTFKLRTESLFGYLFWSGAQLKLFSWADQIDD